MCRATVGTAGLLRVVCRAINSGDYRISTCHGLVYRATVSVKCAEVVRRCRAAEMSIATGQCVLHQVSVAVIGTGHMCY